MSLSSLIRDWAERSIKEDVEEPVGSTDFSVELFRKYLRFVYRLYWELFGRWKFLIQWHAGEKKMLQVLVRLSRGNLDSTQWLEKWLKIYRWTSLISLASGLICLAVYFMQESAGFLYLSIIAFLAFLFCARKYGNWSWSLKRELLYQSRKDSENRESSAKGELDEST